MGFGFWRLGFCGFGAGFGFWRLGFCGFGAGFGDFWVLGFDDLGFTDLMRVLGFWVLVFAVPKSA